MKATIEKKENNWKAKARDFGCEDCTFNLKIDSVNQWEDQCFNWDNDVENVEKLHSRKS